MKREIDSHYSVAMCSIDDLLDVVLSLNIISELDWSDKNHSSIREIVSKYFLTGFDNYNPLTFNNK